MIIYLAGPIKDCDDGEVYNWREWATDELLNARHIVMDPTERDMRGQEFDPYWLVEADKDDIDDSDVVLANAWKPSVGTSMEIIYAFERDKDVYVVGEDLSPWHIAHATKTFETIEEAVESLTKIEVI